MTASMERRLARLEAMRRDNYIPPPDVTGLIDEVRAMHDAREAGRPYSMRSLPDDGKPPEPRSELAQRCIDSMERIAERMRAQEGFAEWEAECEKRKAATIRAIEREAA
jgi:hypothetical protein